MGSTEKDQTTQHHPPHISSLVVRPSGSNDGETVRHSTDAEDYEPGEVTHDRPSFPRSDRNKSSSGHRTRATSSSPSRRGYEEHRHGSDLNHSGALPRGREFSSRREAPGRLRDYSPPYPRGAGGRPYGRGLDGPGPAHRSEGISRNNNPKVQPRDGDWYCLDPLCRNLNFARREYCNKCKRHRYAPDSPPPPRLPPPMNLSPRRDFNGYRSPPRGWPRDYPPPRHDPPTWRDRDRERDHRLHYSEPEYPPNRRRASDWVHTEPLPKPHYERRQPLSPPPPPLPRGARWGRLPRERSRSPPLRDGPPGPPLSSRGGGPPPVRDYRHDSYFDGGGRDDRRGGGGRHRMGNSY